MFFHFLVNIFFFLLVFHSPVIKWPHIDWLHSTCLSLEVAFHNYHSFTFSLITTGFCRCGLSGFHPILHHPFCEQRFTRYLVYLALLEIVCPQRQRQRLTFWILSANVVKNRNQTNETGNSSSLCFILLLVQEETSLQLPTAALQCHTQAALDFSLGIRNKRNQNQKDAHHTGTLAPKST